MSSDDATVRVEGLSKAYLLWDDPRDRLLQPVRNQLQRLGAPPKQYYQQFWALRDVSFELAPHETLGIIGKNGSGKSTLLEILAGTLTPTAGTVDVRGRVSALLELGAGFNPEFTGRENVYMNGAILGLSKDEIDERYERIIEFADIGDFIDQPVKLCSSGMFMRLAFAVAVSVDPDVLIVDEALSVGDVFFVQKCMRFMRRFREEHCLVFVSHDMGAVTGICDRAILLDQGEIKAQGSAKHVCELFLEQQFGDHQDVSAAQSGSSATSRVTSPGGGGLDVVDQRLRYVNSSSLRNDIEVFSFDPDGGSFGAGGVTLTDVRLADAESGAPLSWVVGGELIELRVEGRAERSIMEPIVGFYVKDRLGQTLFGENTFLTYRSRNVPVAAGSSFAAGFRFRMPVMPVGDYAVSVAIADGTQSDHTQLTWIHDAFVFRSHATSVATGLVGVPMAAITLDVVEE